MTKKKPQVLTRKHEQREGKGFSRNELKGAGLSVREALRRGFPVDLRRRTAHKENVKAVKESLKSEGKRAKKKRKPKRRKSPGTT